MLSIRVRDFARNNFKEPTDESKQTEFKISNNNNNPDIISLSSEEHCTKAAKAKNKTKGKRKTKSKNCRPSPRRGRLSKIPVNFNCHKITEYFSQTKKDFSDKIFELEKKEEKEIHVNSIVGNDKVINRENNESDKAAVLTKQLRVVLKRIDVSEYTELKQKRMRKRVTDQKKLTEFIDCKLTTDGYFTTYSNSTVAILPPTSMVRIDNVELLHKTFVDQINTSPILVKERPLIKLNSSSNEAAVVELNADHMNGIKFNGNATIDKNAKYNLRPKKKKTQCPSYKIINGTKLAVDAFRYGDIDDVDHYFLSHFHADHYIGLKKRFNHHLYLSEITGRLVEEFIKVDSKYIHNMVINSPIIVDHVEVTALEANHCPGAVMFLFKLTTGQCILHTGDFRACPEMEEYPEFWNNAIDTIYLDTTYLSGKYDFQSKGDSIRDVLIECGKFIEKTSSGSGKSLIVCGAYKIGKEKVWLSIAQEFNYKVWVDVERRKALNCIHDSNLLSTLTDSMTDANIHVLPLAHLSYTLLTDYLDKFSETFSALLAIRPSGWEKHSKKPNYNSRISILGIQYSEHSSYSELERFVRFLQPKEVISTVPFSGKNLEKTPKVPHAWLTAEVKAKKSTFQPSIVSFMTTSKLQLKAKTKSELAVEKTESVQRLSQGSKSTINEESITDYMP